MPSRGRRLVEGELSSGESAPPRDIAKARKAIAEIVLGMASRNEIELRGAAASRGGVSLQRVDEAVRRNARSAMRGDVDPEDKTEEPTEKHLHDAAERGEVAFSREAPLFASLSATLVALDLCHSCARRSPSLRALGLIGDPAGWRIRRGEDVIALAALWWTPACVSAAYGDPSHRRGILSSVAQSPPRIVPEGTCRRFAHLAAPRLEPRLWRSQYNGIPEEPHQARGGDRGGDDDADRPEGGPAHGDGCRSRTCCRSTCSI